VLEFGGFYNGSGIGREANIALDSNQILMNLMLVSHPFVIEYNVLGAEYQIFSDKPTG